MLRIKIPLIIFLGMVFLSGCSLFPGTPESIVQVLPSTVSQIPATETLPIPIGTATATITPKSIHPILTVTPTASSTPTPTLDSKEIQAAVQELLDFVSSGSPQVAAPGVETMYLYDYENIGMLSHLTPDDSKETWIRDSNLKRFSHLSFANFLNLIVYMDEQGNFWIADLDDTQPVKIYSDAEVAEALYADWQTDIAFSWTPDDQHILINLSMLGKPNLMFHLKSGVTETWEYACDRAAISPLTGNVAVWCPKADRPQHYAVIEWGGEIWYSDKASDKLLFVPLGNYANKTADDQFERLPVYQNAAWSADGKLIAYFDPQDASGALTISTMQGKILSQIPGKAYWLVESSSNRKAPITWSQDGRRVLFRGADSKGDECPPITDNLLGTGETTRIPGCWQVLDVVENKIVWHQASLVAQDGRDPGNWPLDYDFPSISPSGRYITFYSFLPANYKLYVIEVDTGRILFSALSRGVFSHWKSDK